MYRETTKFSCKALDCQHSHAMKAFPYNISTHCNGDCWNECKHGTYHRGIQRRYSNLYTHCVFLSIEHQWSLIETNIWPTHYSIYIINNCGIQLWWQSLLQRVVFSRPPMSNIYRNVYFTWGYRTIIMCMCDTMLGVTLSNASDFFLMSITYRYIIRKYHLICYTFVNE